MLTNSQARTIINAHIDDFKGIERERIQLINQPNFKPPSSGLWCRVTVQYSSSEVVAINNGGLERDYGIISIQCFSRKGQGDIRLIELADSWRKHWHNFNSSHFEVIKTNAPTEASTELDTDFIMSLVRVDFRVN